MLSRATQQSGTQPLKMYVAVRRLINGEFGSSNCIKKEPHASMFYWNCRYNAKFYSFKFCISEWILIFRTKMHTIIWMSSMCQTFIIFKKSSNYCLHDRDLTWRTQYPVGSLQFLWLRRNQRQKISTSLPEDMLTVQGCKWVFSYGQRFK